MTSEQPFALMRARVDLTAYWADHVESVVVEDHRALAIHMTPERAAQLAADLIKAVAETPGGRDQLAAAGIARLDPAGV